MIAAIREIINPDVVLNITTGDQELVLKEPAPDSKIKRLRIKGVPESSFAFTLDHQPKKNNRLYKQLSCYVDVSNQKGINKGCDLILLVPNENGFTVLLFDLKSKKIKVKDVEKQLLNSELYVRYLMAMVQNYYGIDINNIEYKRSIVTTSEKKGLSKSNTYQPNEKRRSDDVSFDTYPVRVHRKEAFVYLRALLK